MDTRIQANERIRELLAATLDGTLTDTQAEELAGFDDRFQRSARHRRKMNVLFADGSVSAKGTTELHPHYPGGDALWAP